MVDPDDDDNFADMPPLVSSSESDDGDEPDADSSSDSDQPELLDLVMISELLLLARWIMYYYLFRWKSV